MEWCVLGLTLGKDTVYSAPLVTFMNASLPMLQICHSEPLPPLSSPQKVQFFSRTLQQLHVGQSSRALDSPWWWHFKEETPELNSPVPYVASVSKNHYLDPVIPKSSNPIRRWNCKQMDEYDHYMILLLRLHIFPLFRGSICLTNHLQTARSCTTLHDNPFFLKSSDAVHPSFASVLLSFSSPAHPSSSFFTQPLLNFFL